MNTITYTVSGRGVFYIDMLRYDCSFPETQVDAAKIQELIDGTADREARRSWEIRLTTEKRPGAPNVDRWRSFGVRVVTIDGLPT